MPTNLTLKNVPDEVYERLKSPQRPTAGASTVRRSCASKRSSCRDESRPASGWNRPAGSATR